MLSKVAANQEAAKSHGVSGAGKKSVKVAHRAAKKAAPAKLQNEEASMQMGIELCHKLGEQCKVDTSDFAMSPFDQTLWRVFGSYAKRTRPSLLYSNARTVNMVGGRVLFAAICCKVGIKPPFNTSGCSLWNHQWSCGEHEPKVRCLHGDCMLRKENVVELTPSSEAGMTALRDGKGVLATNRWGRQSVRVSQETAAVCSMDGPQKFGNFGKNSCGVTFTDTNKARMAMRNAAATTEVTFPGAKASHLLFMPMQCECNYGGKSCLGRQVCKITPFSVPGLENVAAADVDALRAPFVQDPAVFVFQCCNFSASKRSTQKSCDFKVSHPDMLGALATARKLWQVTFGENMPIQFELLKWGPELQVKNAALPEVGVCVDANPFGDLPASVCAPSTSSTGKTAKSSASRKRLLQMVVSSEEEETEETDEAVRPSSKRAARVASEEDDSEPLLVEDSQPLIDSEAEEL